MIVKFKTFHIKRYRSILDISLEFKDGKPFVICGENNIGKTNILRAINLFFNHIYDNGLFLPNRDIPHHIYHGCQGAGSKTELIGTFEHQGIIESIKVTFKNDGT